MANGELCKHCGRQETQHIRGHEYDSGDPSKRVKGYRKSLLACRGFVSEVKEIPMSKEEWKHYSEAIEKQGEARFAWGNYASIVRQRNFDDKIEKLDRAIKISRTDEDVTQAKANKEKYLEECRRSNCIHIG